MLARRYAKSVFDACKVSVSNSVSDIHLKTGSLPYCRDNNGHLIPLPIINSQPLDEGDVIDFCKLLYEEMLNSEALPKQFQVVLDNKSGEADASGFISLPDSSSSSLRLNLYYSQSGLCLAVRVLRSKALTMDDIMLPMALRDLRHKKEGLILFCGATGSGKTTAMYSMLDAINNEESKHIITLDDPIEIVLKGQKCIISQREIGMHTASFDDGLRSALREDPDILLVGEMRDKATIRTALQAAQTGHLVLSTIHTASVSEVVDRILSYFSADDAPQLRTSLAASFLGIVACKLLPRKGGGRVSAFEVLLRTVATTAVIKNGNMMVISDYMSQGQGMQTMEQAENALRYSHLIEDNEDGW